MYAFQSVLFVFIRFSFKFKFLIYFGFSRACIVKSREEGLIKALKTVKGRASEQNDLLRFDGNSGVLLPVSREELGEDARDILAAAGVQVTSALG